MQPAVAIQVENVSKTYAARPSAVRSAIAPSPAVRDVSFDVLHGEIFGLIGPNGSGKSTLMRLIAAALTADSGHISLLSGGAARPQAVVNRLPLDAGLFKKLSPLDNLLHSARLAGMRPGETRRRALEILQRLGLAEDDAARPTETLSHGMQQKVAMARAFLGEPRVLLLDEPTAGLDPRSRREAHAFMRSLRDQHGTTVLLITHDLHEAESLCDRLAVMHHGRIAAMGAPAQLKRSLSQRAGGQAATLEDVYFDLTGAAPELPV